jgi:hypothetical protein
MKSQPGYTGAGGKISTPGPQGLAAVMRMIVQLPPEQQARNQAMFLDAARLPQSAPDAENRLRALFQRLL